MAKTTIDQDNLFRVSVENFVRAKPRHRYLLAKFTDEMVMKWGADKLPGLTLRARVLNFIWNHPCFCKCLDIEAECY